MTTPTDPEDAVEQNTLGPKRVQVGNQSVEQHPLPDQIAADQYLKSQTAQGKNHIGLVFRKMKPPGAG